MCIKHESEGYDCFDHFFILEADFLELMEQYGAKITDVEKAREELFQLLDNWHERGIMTPGDRTSAEV